MVRSPAMMRAGGNRPCCETEGSWETEFSAWDAYVEAGIGGVVAGMTETGL